ncbi:MAG TPA: FAD-dependent thymidylate synthase [Nitrospirota bacterium]|nr:FAD-dependent thymidylate synthase [Nitrospirota bacterium]
MNSFLSSEPIVKLEKAFTNPFRNLVATAQTCYSGRGIINEDNITEDYRKLAKSIYKAGHHTTLQHAHFQFAISNVSRQFVWSFLHSHPFYNSEQVSQRYVTVKPGNFLVPPLKGRALALYEKTIAFQMEEYSRLSKELLPIARNEYLRLFRVNEAKGSKRKKARHETPQLDLPFFKSADDLNRAVIKKAQEAARYVIPVAAFTYLYHTISAVTLLRYYRLCKMYDTPLEQQIVVGKMVQEVLRVEPLYKVILEEPLEADAMPEYQFFQAEKNARTSKLTKRFLGEFDERLDGRISQLVDYKHLNEDILAQSVREVLGIPSSKPRDKRNFSDQKAIRLILDPSVNKLYGETLNLSTISKLTRTLSHVSYTFRKRISHTADSQDQRHRNTPASRPCLHRHITDEPDYITPAIISQDTRIEKRYSETMDRIWDSITRLRKLGVSNEYAMYLLPNAVAIRFTESGDLLNLRHKYAMRLCYNAQEEIWRASLDEVEQICKVNPKIGKYLLPPCTSRDMAEVRPVCPEGERFCGVKVWRLKLRDYKRII